MIRVNDITEVNPALQRRITAVDIADHYGLNPKTYRAALRRQAHHDPRLSGHVRNARWEVEVGSPSYDAMIEVAERLAARS